MKLFLSGIIVDEGTYFNNRSLLSESATLQNIDSQIPLYLEKYPMVFIKPQYGSI